MDPGLCALITLAILLMCLLFSRGLTLKFRRHDRYRKRAKNIYLRINKGDFTGGQAINYLRKANPYVFEELVLYALSRNGYEIERNERYSGDGGIDGKVKVNGTWSYIQCKRYKKHIRPEDVEEFIRICRRDGVDGFFVHTGRTGKKSKTIIAGADCVSVISGKKLIRLLYDKRDFLL